MAPSKKRKVRRAAPAAAARSARCARAQEGPPVTLPPCAQASADVEVLAELTADEVQARKRAKAETDGDLVDLTALSEDEDEEAAVARGKAQRAKRAAADAAAAKKAVLKLGPRLIDAATAGYADAVSRLLKEGADVAFADSEGDTALHFAAWNGHAEAVNVLLAAGASASRENEDGKTPVHDAVVGMVERGSSVTAALFALVESLANDDDALVALVSGDDSPLCAAARAGEKPAMKILIVRGCYDMDYAAVREALRPALFEAQEYDAFDCVEYLRGLPLHLRDPDGNSLCLLAYDDHAVSDLANSLNDVVSLFDCTDGNIMLSCKGKLLDKDEPLGCYKLPDLALAPDNGAPAHRDGCIHILSNSLVGFFRAVAGGKVADVARCIKDSGIYLNMHDCYGIIEDHEPADDRSGCPDEHWMNKRDARPTALWDAVHMGRASLVNKLLSLGADVSTCLLVDPFPAGFFAGAFGLECGGETPLHAAARLRTTTIAAALIKAGADVNSRCGAEHSGSIVANATPLYWAVRCSNLAMVKLLLAKGADPRDCRNWESRDEKAGRSCHSRSLLHLAAGRFYRSLPAAGSSSTGDDLKATLGAIIAALASAGAAVNAVDKEGKTVLHYAAHFDCVDAIDALLAAGADASVRDKHGKTPLAVAMHLKHAAVVSRLSELGLPDTIARRLMGSAQRLFTRRSL